MRTPYLLVWIAALAIPVGCPTVADDDSGAYEGDDAGECADDADNDQDGLFDCDDPDCEGSDDCDDTGSSGDDDDDDSESSG